MPARPRRHPTAFVVHGHDLRARNVVERWLRALGFRTPRFEETADRAGALPIISDVVRRAIADADVVVVLFTPDELAVLYEPFAGASPGEPSLSRWQSRPNVLFEAGWAFGLKADRTLFVTLGEDTTLFSDVSGYHAVRLDGPAARESLKERLRQMLQALPNERAALPAVDPRELRRVRFRFHDELASLLTTLRNTEVRLAASRRRRRGKRRAAFRQSLLSLLDQSVRANPEWSWEHRKPIDLILDIKERHSDGVANVAFWWLTSAGFFQFSDIERWGDHYEECSHITSFAPRGLSLLKWLAARRRTARA